jgi:hypothetical protein
VTERTVQRHINTLIELGEVERVMNDGGTHRTAPHMRPNLYRILLRCPASCDGSTQHRMSELSDDPVTPVSPGDASVTPPPDTSVTPPVTPVSPEPSLNLPLNLPEKNVETYVPTSPVEISHPNWLTSEQAQQATDTLRHASMTLQDGIETYEASPVFHGKHDPKKFGQWVGIVTRLARAGQAIPVREVITVDTPESMEEAFAQFWEAFPKKERRAVAIAAFKAAVKKVPANIIISGARSYANSVKLNNVEDQFVTMPHNWLNDERWTDQHRGKSWSHTAADD